MLLGVLEEHSRLARHLQSYQEETAETFAHRLCQVLQKRALMTEELRRTLADHAMGNYAAPINMAAQLLAVAAQREASQLDENCI